MKRRKIMPQLGVPELLIILVIIVVIFGVGRLPEIGGAIGKSIREFKTQMTDDEKAAADAKKSAEDEPDNKE